MFKKKKEGKLRDCGLTDCHISTLTWSCTSWGWYPKCQPALPCWWTSACWGRTSSHRSLQSPSGPEQRNRAALTGGAAAPPHEEQLHPGHLGLWPPSSARSAGTCRWCGWSPSCWRTTGPLGSRRHKHMTGEEGSWKDLAPPSPHMERSRTCGARRAWTRGLGHGSQHLTEEQVKNEHLLQIHLTHMSFSSTPLHGHSKLL